MQPFSIRVIVYLFDGLFAEETEEKPVCLLLVIFEQNWPHERERWGDVNASKNQFNQHGIAHHAEGTLIAGCQAGWPDERKRKDSESDPELDKNADLKNYMETSNWRARSEEHDLSANLFKFPFP